MKQSLGAKTIAFSVPVWIIGTYDDDGEANVMTASWTGICCSRPPCVNLSLRKATYTYGCIEKRRAFTVNIPSQHQVREADFFGIASGRDVNKLAITGMTAVKSDLVDAPYLDEAPLVLECSLLHSYELGLHTLFVGEIRDVKAETSVLSKHDLPDPEKVKPIVYGPEVRTYHGLGSSLGLSFDLGKALAEQTMPG
jgi:flavin reductase (DIM6/NTAB) family NADH-FMN oxidoreductase RutF